MQIVDVVGKGGEREGDFRLIKNRNATPKCKHTKGV